MRHLEPCKCMCARMKCVNVRKNALCESVLFTHSGGAVFFGHGGVGSEVLPLNTTREAWRRPRRGFQRARHWSHFLGCCAQAQGRPLCLDKGGRTLSTGTRSVSGCLPELGAGGQWSGTDTALVKNTRKPQPPPTHPLLLVPLLPVGLLNPRSCCPAFSLSQLLHPAL